MPKNILTKTEGYLLQQRCIIPTPLSNIWVERGSRRTASCSFLLWWVIFSQLARLDLRQVV